MSTKNPEPITLHLLIDKTQNRVLFAESDNNFIDTLFTFLTLPIGQAIRLLRKQQKSQPQTLTVLGSYNTLYKAIENLDDQIFLTKNYKSALLRPFNPSQAQCRKVKLNIDDTKPTKYYLCEDCYQLENALVGIFPNKECKCGKVRSKEMFLVDDFDGVGSGECEEGVFVKGMARFIITDDLRVLGSSAVGGFELLRSLGVWDLDSVIEISVEFGLPEVLSLLRLSLHSKTPLTDLIFLKHVPSSGMFMFEQEVLFQSRKVIDTFKVMKEITLKVMLRKSDSKVLYAEAEEDFVDFLLILPAITLGSMVKLLHYSPSLGCISNLYKSVESLSVDRYMKSEDMKAKLLSPKLGLQFYECTTKCQMTTIFNDNCKTIHADPTSSICKNPESPTLETIGERRIIAGPAMYMVTDDLTVTPLSPISSISILNCLKVPFNDLDVRVVTFGDEEALKLLEASLISKSALTAAFDFNVSRKKPKLENCSSNFY